MSEIRLLIRVTVVTAKVVVENPDKPADWVVLTLHAFRIELGNFHRETIDLLSEIPGVLVQSLLLARIIRRHDPEWCLSIIKWQREEVEWSDEFSVDGSKKGIE